MVRPRVNAQILESEAFNRLLSVDFPHRTGMSVKALLDTIDMVLEKSNCAAWVMLEVRADNAPALVLYEGAGYEVLATRRGYYAPGAVDALVMRKALRRDSPERDGTDHG